MKRYEAILLLIVLITLSIVTLKLSNKRVQQALEQYDKCKVVLDHNCLEYGNCKCE